MVLELLTPILSDGIIRGKGALIALTNNGDSNSIIDINSTQYLSLSKSVTSSQSYPSSIMGALCPTQTSLL